MVCWGKYSPQGKVLDGSDSKGSAYNAGDPRSGSWVRKTLWRREWQPTPIILPGKSHGQKSLAGYTVYEVTKSQTQLSNSQGLEKFLRQFSREMGQCQQYVWWKV